MFRRFEQVVDPYPQTPLKHLPTRLVAFLWACTRGVRRQILYMTLATAAIGVFEALLFRMLGHLVDWLATVDRVRLFATERDTMMVFGAILIASIPLVGYQSLVRRQGLAGNFAMRLRWDFHRRMLAQSLAFYQDEFAGRVATKVMQTALAVRDAWFIVTDILVYIALYFATVLWVVGDLDRKSTRLNSSH